MTIVRYNEHIITAQDCDGDDCILLSPYLLSLGLDYCVNNDMGYDEPLNSDFGWEVNDTRWPLEEGLTEEELNTYRGLYVDYHDAIANEILELYKEKTNA